MNNFWFGQGQRQTNFTRQTWSVAASLDVGAKGLTKVFAKFEGSVDGSYFSDQYTRASKFSFFREKHGATRYHGQNVYYRGVTYWQAPWQYVEFCTPLSRPHVLARGRVRGNIPQEFGNIVCSKKYRQPLARYVHRNNCG